MKRAFHASFSVPKSRRKRARSTAGKLVALLAEKNTEKKAKTTPKITVKSHHVGGKRLRIKQGFQIKTGVYLVQERAADYAS